MVHVEIEYDYRFQATQRKRDDILFVLKHCYHKMHGRNLSLFGVSYPHLKDFTTSKKDALKKISKKPPKGNMIKSENLFDDNGVAVPRKSDDDESKDHILPIDSNFEERKSTGPRATIFSKVKGEEV